MYKKLVLAIIVLVVCGAWFYCRVGRRIEYPRNVMIMAVTGRVQKVAWEAPPGKMFSMLLGTPGGGHALASLKGTLRFLDGTQVLLEQNFGPDDLEDANWLGRDGRVGVIIGRLPSRMDGVISRIWRFDVELTLDEPPEGAVELWASWLTSPRIEDDVREARRAQMDARPVLVIYRLPGYSLSKPQRWGVEAAVWANGRVLRREDNGRPDDGYIEGKLIATQVKILMTSEMVRGLHPRRGEQDQLTVDTASVTVMLREDEDVIRRAASVPIYAESPVERAMQYMRSLTLTEVKASDFAGGIPDEWR